MNNIIYIVYINEQSSKPLVHSIEEAKKYAVRNLQYKPSLRIECYCMPVMISKWIYDYHHEGWVEEVVTNSASLYQRVK